ncbi:MAG: hypothetical protein K0S00_3952 [Xanthobacteraceae bacterium]|jgi:hypothetical protein|nr:hypothetical protein [Xanthobacteraceae bacterium]
MNTPVSQSQFADAEPVRPAGLRRPDIGEAIRRRAEMNPNLPVFLHKRRDRWQVFTWSYVAREVDRLAAVLRARGISGELRLAVSGSYEPDLVVLSLAALAAGGEVFALSPKLRGAELARELAAIGPSHAFVQSRRAIAQWFAAGPPAATRLPLFSPQAFVGGHEGWDVVPLHNPVSTLAHIPGRWARLRRTDVVWVDEGTEWTEGLARLLDGVFDDAVTLAFPETAESATRDRRQVRPSALLLSPERRQRLIEEDRARRTPEGSLSRWLTDGAEAAPAGLLARFVNARRRAVLGLSRVRRPALPNIASVDLAADPAPVTA